MAALLDVLGASARGAYNFLRGLANDGFTANDALQTLQNAGIALRRDTGLTLYRVIQNRGDVADFIKLIGEDNPLPDAAHTIAPLQFSGGANYQYLVGTNSTNELIPEAIYINSAVALTANEIYDRASAAFSYEEGSGMSADLLDQITFSIDDARYAPGSAADIAQGGSAALGI
jgi:hypothetical protein